METDVLEPKFNFPHQLQLRHSGRCGKRRHLFIDYGNTGMIDVDKDGEIFSQKMKGDNLSKYAAVNPVLPLSDTAEDVKLGVRDRIIGLNIDKNKKLKSFLQRVQKIYSHGRKFGKIDALKDILSMIRELVSNFKVDEGDINKANAEEFANSMVPEWFTEMFNDYTKIEGYIPKYHNFMYEGGCMDTISIDDNHCYTVSAARKKFNHLRLTFVSKKSEGLLQSFISEELKLPNTIYGVKSRKVQGRDYVTVMTGGQCLLYNFTSGSQEGKLSLVHDPLNQRFQAVDISPYIPGECVLVDEEGQCCLWSHGSLNTIPAHGESRFHVSDNWRHVQYGSHPKHVIFADQTAVQMFDLRIKEKEGIDLFSLPSELLYNRERIRACSRHPASPFYHLVATDYKLLIMDERYQKYPVLRWEHMLTSPPQYMSSLHDAADDNFIYIGSQYPADVHAFRFSAHHGQPPLSVAQPYRASSIIEISKWPQFLDNCPNVDLLHNRLDTSLAGIATAPWQHGHVIFQMDSNGEIFHQVFSRNCPSSADVTFSAEMGSWNLKPNLTAVERAQCWINSWGEMMKRQLANEMKTREIKASVLGIFNNSIPHQSCCVCKPDLIHVPGHDAATEMLGYCDACLVKLTDGPNFIKSIQKDEVIAMTSELRPFNLIEVKDVPTDNALSKLLMKDWFGDDDSSTMEEIMRNWDDEVIEKRSAKKSVQKNHLPDMSEESVMDRILSRSTDQAGSNHFNVNISSDMENVEPSIASSTDDRDGGQRSRKRRHSAENVHNIASKTLSSKSARKSETEGSSGKQSEREVRKLGGSVKSFGVVSTDESLVLGSSLSDMSMIFPVVDGNNSSTDILRSHSLLGNQQIKHKSNTSHKETTPLASQKKTSSTGSKIHSGQNKSVPLSKPTSEGHVVSSGFKIPSSPGKKTKNQYKRPSPSGSSFTVKTASDMSVNTGSEDLFGSPGDDTALSSEFSAASCGEIFKSQLSQKSVSRQLFSGEKSQEKPGNSTVNSPSNIQCGISPRKPSQKKHLSGF